MCRVLFLTACFGYALAFFGGPHGGPPGPPLFMAEKCCNKDLMLHPTDAKELMKECFQVHMKPPSCEQEMCIAEKKGFASSDGTIDKKALQEQLDKDFANNPEALDAISENCVNGDLSKYGREDFCELMKLGKCIEVQVFKSCDDWKDDDECTMAKTFVDNMIKKFQ